MRLGRIVRGWTREGFIQANEQKLDFAELCCNSQADAEKLVNMTDELRESMAISGLDISCIGRWNHDVQEGGKLVEERKKTYMDLLDASIDLGAKTFVAGINYDDSISLYRNYSNAVDFFAELTERAAGRIKVAIQNCSWNNFIVSPEHWKIVLGENPDLYIKFDASHTYNRYHDYLAELSDWCHRVAHVHIKGTVHAGSRPVDDPPAGMDDINWRSLFAILYSRGYDGDLSIEPHSAVWHGELGNSGVIFTRDYIRSFMLK